MAENFTPHTPDSRYLTLDSIVKNYLLSAGEETDRLYNKALHYAIKGVNQFAKDIYGNETHLLAVDSDTKQAEFPEGIANWVNVGFVNQVNEFVPLTYNPNLVFTPKRKACHCPCECDGTGCTLTTPEATYGTTTMLTPQRQAVYISNVIFDFETCDYTLDLNGSSIQTIVSYKKNGITTTVNEPIADLSALQTYMASLGFSVTGDPLIFENTNETSLWQNIITDDGTGTLTTHSMTESNCSTSAGRMYPFTINSITRDGETINTNTFITNITQLEAYWEAFDFVFDAYTITSEPTSVEWESFTINSVTGIETVIYFQPTEQEFVDIEVEYQTKEIVCTDGDNITREICAPAYVDNIEPRFDWSVTLADLTFPQSAIVIMNDAALPAVTIDSQEELDDYMRSLGFSRGYNANAGEVNYFIVNTINTFTSISVGDEFLFVQDLEYPTRLVEEQCQTQSDCVPVAECGCPVYNNATINTLTDWGYCFGAAFVQRYINGGDIGQQLAIPNNYFGYFNVDVLNGIIQLNPDYPYDTVAFIGMPAQPVTSHEYLILSPLEEPLKWWIRKSFLDFKLSVPKNARDEARREYAVARHNAIKQIYPLRIPTFIDISRSRQKA